MSALNGGGKVVQLLDGPHVVKFTTNRLIDCEDEFGSLDGVLAGLNAKPFRSTRFLLWVLLGKDRSLDDVGELIDLRNLKPVADALSAALGEAVGADAAADEPEAGPTSEVAPILSATS
jgi:hypothetical protein